MKTVITIEIRPQFHNDNNQTQHSMANMKSNEVINKITSAIAECDLLDLYFNIEIQTLKK